jgi:hypothetical protein
MRSHLSDPSTNWPPSEHLFHHTDFLWTDQIFCITVLFIDMLEKLKTYSESSFPDGSKDTNFSTLGLSKAEQMLFKLEKISERFLPVSGANMLLVNCFCVFKRWLHSSELASSAEIGVIRLEVNILNMSLKIFLHICEWMTLQNVLNFIFHSLIGGRGRAVGQIGPQR